MSASSNFRRNCSNVPPDGAWRHAQVGRDVRDRLTLEPSSDASGLLAELGKQVGDVEGQIDITHVIAGISRLKRASVVGLK